MKKKYFIIMFITLFLSTIILYILYILNYIPHKKYTNEYFRISTYTSSIDKDNDGLDDQTDILNGVKKYIKTKPKYKSKYYESGYPNDGYGVCTDVVAFALKEAGYDLKELINEDIKSSKDRYNVDVIDKNIDFRRVKNIKIYLDNHAISLTTDIYNLSEWQGGDIVVLNNHIGIVSDKRNKKGITFIFHHANNYQRNYEEDILEYHKDIIGHYRIS